MDVAGVLDPPLKILQPAKYEWIIENRLLVPTRNFAIASDLTTKYRCKKERTKNCGCGRTFNAPSIATVQFARTFRFLKLIWFAL